MNNKYCIIIALDIISLSIQSSDIANIPPISTHCPITSDKSSESCWLEKAKNVASIGAAFLATSLAAFWAHEMGHACTYKYFTGIFPKITISPFGGTCYASDQMLSNNLEKVIFYAAGPIMGTLASYIIYKTFVYKKEETHTQLSHNINIKLATLALGLTNIINLLPIDPTFDGYQILRVLGQSHLLNKQSMTMLAIIGYGLIGVLQYQYTSNLSKEYNQKLEAIKSKE
jgi:Zn-dependent protease